MTVSPDPARVLVVGSGGREHALAWRLGRDPGVERVIVAPGNPGMLDLAETRPDVRSGDADGIVRLAKMLGCDLVVVGPERPLADGLADALASAGVAVFGPARAAARLEWSKAWCREVADACGVPMATGAAFDDPDAASRHVRRLGAPVVVKADGLAAGKGVAVCASVEEAEDAIRDAMVRGAFGRAGERVVVERALQGREVSAIAIADGETVLPLPLARDHKRAEDGDRGPNTGGMGAHSPVDDLPDESAAKLVDRFHRPLIAELARRGIRYSGALYVGLMLTDDGPYLLECNARFGDPEAQAILPRVEVPLARLLAASAMGRLAEAMRTLGLSEGRVPGSGAAVAVVLAAPGYPEAPLTGDPIRDERATGDEALVFWSGVARGTEGRLVTAGGRVATAVGRGRNVADAAEDAYAIADAISFAGRQLRRDIGRAPALAGAIGGAR